MSRHSFNPEKLAAGPMTRLPSSTGAEIACNSWLEPLPSESWSGKDSSISEPAAEPVSGPQPASAPALSPAASQTHDSDPTLSSHEAITSHLKNLGTAHDALRGVESLAAWRQGLLPLFAEVQWLHGFARAKRFAVMAQLSASLQTHLAELHDCQAKITSSTVQSVAQAVDLLTKLGQLSLNGTVPDWQLRALVAAGNTNSCDDLIRTLESTGIVTTTCVSFHKALRSAAETRYDLVVVNLEELLLPYGLELCGGLRELPHGSEMTVIAINGPSGLEHLARAVVAEWSESGPLCFSELLLRAAICAIRKRLELSCHGVSWLAS